ncbi:MAG: hypothetical protein EXR71_00840 [Myxococcales bacterium]|nr:hypothetical protein [Myxococcales bacterium]
MPRALLLLLTTGCLIDSSQSGVVCDGEVVSETLALTSDADGVLEIPVAVDDNDDAFMVTTARRSGTLSTDGVVDPAAASRLDWEDWIDTRDSLTNAFFATTEVSVLNWPVRAEDGPLSPGEWTVLASTLDGEGYPRGEADAEVTVVRRSCLPGRATLIATIAYADSLDADRVVSGAVTTAAERWAELFGAYGIDLDLRYVRADIDGSIAEPLMGDEEYAAIYEEIGEGVVVVIGEDVAGFADLYGEAGGIPGPLVPSSHSGVAVSWLVHAGTDAVFSGDEIEVLAETMAHEVGHYLGLFHPVESNWKGWDALSDTKRCTATGACEAALADNLMFPYPVCGNNSCTAQTALSDDQVGVLQLNVGLR